MKSYNIFWGIAFLISLEYPVFAQTLQWSSFVDSITSFSSPRPVELTGDTIMDIVVGGGEEGVPTSYGMMAFNGANGNLLWNVSANDEVFGSAIFQDITNDGINDVFMGGRYGVFKAIDGSNGQVLWDFFPYSYLIDPSDSGWYQFYSAQFVPDQNTDGYPDILVSNGGDRNALPWDTIRDPGRILVLDAQTGAILANAEVPDGRETYCSPIVQDLKGNGTKQVIFGTGGETIGGGIWVAELTDVMQNDISNAIPLATENGKGFIAPTSITDLNNDGVLDIIAQAFGGTIYAFDGSNYSIMWQVNIPGTESSAEPTIGNFTGSYLEPDVFNVLYKGVAPTYTDYYQIMIDGETGQIEWIDSIADLHFASSIAFDYNKDGRDEVATTMSRNIGTHFTHELKIIDFANDSVFDIVPPEAGVGLASTPTATDMNQDGTIDFVYLTRADSLNPVAANGIYLKRVITGIDTMCSGIAWGSYMANGFDGKYILPGKLCGTMVLNHTKSNPSCNGVADGSINLNVTGGVPPYTYYWNNNSMADTITGLSAGTYKITVIDASCCYVTDSITLSDPYVISFNLSHNPCEGDSMGVATLASSGCPCMSSGCIFGWSNGDSTKTATGLGAGTHYATIIHPDGCIVIDSVEILAPPLIDSSQIQNIICDGDFGEVTLFPRDSNNTTYNWSNGATSSHIDSLEPGTYTVYINNNVPCYDTLVFTIDSGLGDTLNAVIINMQHVSCNGNNDGEIIANASGGTPPYSYYWAPGGLTSGTISGLTAGTYVLTVTDSNGCSSISSAIITEPTQLGLIKNTVSPSSCNLNNGSACVSGAGGTPPYIIVWDDSAATADSCIYGMYAGVYNPLVTDSNGCTFSMPVLINDLGPIIDSVGTSELSCFGDANGTATAFYSNGIAPYTFTWKDGAGDTIVTNSSNLLFGLSGGTYTITIEDFNSCMVSQVFSIFEPTILASTISTTDITCNGLCDGTAQTLINGGTSPYSYSWTNGTTTSTDTGLCGGTYNLLVIDSNGCSLLDAITITEPAVITTSITNTDVSCYGGGDGTVDLSVGGGTSPYSYSWSNADTTEDLSGVEAGTYIITINDYNGCQGFGTTTVGGPNAYILSITTQNVLCNGGTDGYIDLTVSGGTYPYYYSWSNTETTEDINGLASGTYSVIVTDSNGCSLIDSISIGEPAALELSITVMDVSCNGFSDGSIDLLVTGGTMPYTYSWSTGATTEDVTGLAAGNYSVSSVDSNGCSESINAIINEPSAIQTSSIVGPAAVSELSVENYSTSFTVGSIYNWSVLGGNQISGGQTNSITVQWGTQGVGQVSVLEMNQDSCYGDTMYLEVQIGTGVGISSKLSQADMVIYPNPFNHNSKVEFSNENHAIFVLSIYDMIGNMVRIVENISDNEVMIMKNNLNQGIYIIELKGPSEIFRGRIMIE